MKSNEQNVVEQNLLGMSQQDLEQFFSVIDEKSFRATQLMKWMHQQGVADYEQMTNLSKSLRDWLHKNATIQLPEMLNEEYIYRRHA